MSTLPKPFVFVLMPFDPGFDDVYKFGIKGAAEDVGAYAQRLDDQIFTEGILDRIFSQINKADVVVADMTGRNANVFYEVGYAHALNKVVLLLTQNADDIPFDLKHRPHTVYGGSIDSLRKQLGPKLQWAIEEARLAAGVGTEERFSLRIGGTDVPSSGSDGDPTVIAAGSTTVKAFGLPVQLRNLSSEASVPISYVYLFTRQNPDLAPYQWTEWSFGNATFVTSSITMGQPATGQPVELDHFYADSSDSADGLTWQYRLKLAIPAIPPAAVEVFNLYLLHRSSTNPVDEVLRLRLHTARRRFDFAIRLQLAFEVAAAPRKAGP